MCFEGFSASLVFLPPENVTAKSNFWIGNILNRDISNLQISFLYYDAKQFFLQYVTWVLALLVA